VKHGNHHWLTPNLRPGKSHASSDGLLGGARTAMRHVPECVCAPGLAYGALLLAWFYIRTLGHALRRVFVGWGGGEAVPHRLVLPAINQAW